MFKRPYNQKPAAPLRSSERRQLVKEVAARFSIDEELAKALVPDPLLIGKALTHLDAPCTIYSHDKNPVWVRTGKSAADADSILFPTLYTLLRHRSLLPILGTAPPVIEKLAGGADLMAPGLSQRMLAALPDLPAGALVAISSVAEPSKPMALGTMAAAKRQLRDTGKAVFTVHAYGDHLWEAGIGIEPDQLNLANGDAETPDVAALDINEPVDEQPEALTSTAPATEQLKAKEVDDLLRLALLYAIAHTLPQEPGDYPMKSSTIISAHILPSRPASCPADQVDFKHASKKPAAWLKAMAKDGLLNVKDIKGETVVMGVHPDHEDVKKLENYKTVADANRQASKKAAAQQAQPEAGPSENKPMKLTDLYRPHGSTAAFFKACDISKDACLAPHEVRKIVDDYVAKAELAHTNKKLMLLDDVLVGALANKKDQSGANAKGIARPEVVEKLIAGMQRWHVLEREGEEPSLRKGKAEGIEINLKKRQGNKVVSIVTGVENFDLSPAELADSLQKLCSASTSHGPIQGSTPKSPREEVTVQGDQSTAISKLLVSRGVPQRWIGTVNKR